MTFHFDFEPIKIQSINNMFTVTSTETHTDLRYRLLEIVFSHQDGHLDIRYAGGPERQIENAKQIAKYCDEMVDVILDVWDTPAEPEPETSKPTVLNVNSTVRVKLTDHGRSVNTRDLYMSPKEDAEGRSEWKLWQLMQIFGPHMSLGGRPCFEADIEVVA